MGRKVNAASGIKEIARLAGVSIGTVDRVIHNRRGVSDRTKEKVNGIIRELNYHPNILASRLASKKRYRIAIILPEATEENAFWASPLQGIQRATAEISNYGIDLKNYFFDLAEEKNFVSQCRAALKFRPEGVLLAPAYAAAAATFLTDCSKRNIPVVLIDANVSGSSPLSYIGPNMYHSGFQVAHLMTLAQRNLKKILVVEISLSNEEAETEKGFRQYFLDDNLDPEIIKLNIEQQSFKSVARSLRTMFKKHGNIGGIFVSNSRVASVAKFLEREGISEICLIGYDILPENLHYLESKIIDFLICHKPEEQGYRALMTLVQKLVFNKAPEAVQYMPIDIITRENYRFYKN